MSLGEGVTHHLQSVAPDFHRVVFYPTWLQADLRVLSLGVRDACAAAIDHREAGARCALIDRADVFSHLQRASPGKFVFELYCSYSNRMLGYGRPDEVSTPTWASESIRRYSNSNTAGFETGSQANEQRHQGGRHARGERLQNAW